MSGKAVHESSSSGAEVLLRNHVGRRAELADQVNRITSADLQMAAFVDAATDRIDVRERSDRITGQWRDHVMHETRANSGRGALGDHPAQRWSSGRTGRPASSGRHL